MIMFHFFITSPLFIDLILRSAGCARASRRMAPSSHYAALLRDGGPSDCLLGTRAATSLRRHQHGRLNLLAAPRFRLGLRKGRRDVLGASVPRRDLDQR